MSWSISVRIKDGAVEKTATTSQVPDGTYTINGHQAQEGSWSSLSVQSPSAMANVAYKEGA